jgi:hypothetical protein
MSVAGTTYCKQSSSGKHRKIASKGGSRAPYACVTISKLGQKVTLQGIEGIRLASFQQLSRGLMVHTDWGAAAWMMGAAYVAANVMSGKQQPQVGTTAGKRRLMLGAVAAASI